MVSRAEAQEVEAQAGPGQELVPQDVSKVDQVLGPRLTDVGRELKISDEVLPHQGLERLTVADKAVQRRRVTPRALATAVMDNAGRPMATPASMIRSSETCGGRPRRRRGGGAGIPSVKA